MAEYKDIKEVGEMPVQYGIRNSHKEELADMSPELKSEYLQKLADEIRRQRDEILKQKEVREKAMKENNSELEELDGRLPELREKLEKLEARIRDKGIDPSDRGNAYVKQLESLKSQIEADKALKEQLKGENTKIGEDLAKSDTLVAELDSQMNLLDNMRRRNNEARIEAAERKAMNRESDARPVHQQNAVLTALEAMMAAADMHSRKSRMGKEAADAMAQQIEREEASVRKELGAGDRNTEFEDEEKSPLKAMDEKDTIVFMAHDGEKDIIKVMSPRAADAYSKSEEFQNIKSRMEKEADLPSDQRTASMVTLKADDREALLKALEPVAGNAVKYPQDLHEYVSTAEKMAAVKETLFANATLDDSMGGIHYAQYSPEIAMKQAEEMAEKQKEEALERATDMTHPVITPEEEAEIRKLQEEAVREDGSEVLKDVRMPSEEGGSLIVEDDDKGLDIWSDLKEKCNVDRSSLRREDQAKLLAGEVTSKYVTETGDSIRFRPVAHPITNSLSVEIEVYQKVPQYEKLQKSFGLSDADIENLRNVGTLDHQVSYCGAEGLLYRDRETNNFIFVDQSRIRIDKKIQEFLGEEKTNELRQGRPVHCANLKDKQGQPYTGWIIVDPTRPDQLCVTQQRPAFVDKDFKIQVANNNDGGRAESVRNDKDAALKSGQTENDDTKVPDTGKRQYKDYSSEGDSVTEETNKKSKKNGI